MFEKSQNLHGGERKHITICKIKQNKTKQKKIAKLKYELIFTPMSNCPYLKIGLYCVPPVPCFLRVHHMYDGIVQQMINQTDFLVHVSNIFVVLTISKQHRILLLTILYKNVSNYEKYILCFCYNA